MTLSIGKFFRIGMSIGKRQRKLKGWHWGAELFIWKFHCSCSYCSVLNNRSWKLKKTFAPFIKYPLNIYTWGKFTFYYGKVIQNDS